MEIKGDGKIANPNEWVENDEIPDCLKKLTKIILRAFYSPEHSLAVCDILVRNRCVKEEDISKLCKFEKKQLRAILTNLKMEKILRTKVRVEPTPNAEPDPETGKMPTTKYNYYHINYRSIVNIVKYKLHKMQEKIESEERDNSNRASFMCPNCQKTYTDLEVNQLLDPMSGKLICTFCDTEVEEDTSNGPKTDSRTMLAKYNTQIAPLYELLKNSENVEFTPTMIDPEPSYVEALHENKDDDGFGPTIKKAAKNPDGTEKDKWRSTSGAAFEDNIQVEVDLGNDMDDKPKEIIKDQPEWMLKSTVTGDDTNDIISSGANHYPEDDSIDQLLKETEKEAPKAVPKPPQKSADSSDDDFVSDDDEAQFTVAGVSYAFDHIQSHPELVRQMTETERESYQNYVATQMDDFY